LKESRIERRFVTEVKKRGGLAVKFTSPGLAGAPDRIALLPGGRMAFVELKAPGERLRPLQALRKEQLERLGFRVYVIDGMEQMGVVLNAIQSP
jgi:Holliday junction resolvase